jgi:hypothetical protein
MARHPSSTYGNRGRVRLRIILWTILVASLLSFGFLSMVDLKELAEFYAAQVLSARARHNAAQVRIIRSTRSSRNVCTNRNDPLNYVLGTGQSLSSGQRSNPAIDTHNSAWPRWTFMTNLGIRQVPDAGALLPVDPTLIMGLLPIATASTSDGNGETIGATMTWTINDLLRTTNQAPYPVVFTTHGAIRRPYVALQRDSAPYDNALLTIARVSQLVFPRCVVVRALTVIHGEADSLGGTSQATYERDLLDWQRDFTVDLSSVTGQSSQVLEFTDQMNSYTGPLMNPPRSTSVIPLAQLQAAIDHPASVFLVGPKYFLEYTFDGVHLTAASEQLLGEYYGKAYKQTVIDGVPWKPLYPTAFVLSGRFITVTFNVPVPPLVMDRTLVLDPGNAGFAYTEDSNQPPSIVAVGLKAADQVLIRLSHAPNAAPGKRFLSYAWKGIPNNRAGPMTGPRGNLRDSDPVTGRYSGRRLFNWCVTFRRAF